MLFRSILDLKDKLSFDDEMIGREVAATAAENGLKGDTPQKKEAIEALMSLGYTQSESARAVNAIEGIEEMDSGAVLKAALKKMF